MKEKNWHLNFVWIKDRTCLHNQHLGQRKTMRLGGITDPSKNERRQRENVKKNEKQSTERRKHVERKEKNSNGCIVRKNIENLVILMMSIVGRRRSISIGENEADLDPDLTMTKKV